MVPRRWRFAPDWPARSASTNRVDQIGPSPPAEWLRWSLPLHGGSGIYGLAAQTDHEPRGLEPTVFSRRCSSTFLQANPPGRSNTSSRSCSY